MATIRHQVYLDEATTDRVSALLGSIAKPVQLTTSRALSIIIKQWLEEHEGDYEEGEPSDSTRRRRGRRRAAQ